MFEKVLFATDFSPYAKKMLDCIAGFPGIREVVLLHVADTARSPRGGGDFGDSLFRAGKNFLSEERRQLENLNLSIRVTTAVKTSSDIPGAIIAAADEHGASLVVIGARGNSVVEGILLGSVSKALLRRSRTSVLIMRHKIIEEMKRKTYEMFCPMIFNKVLCPVDFSPFSDSAITSLSITPGIRRVILLHVVSQGETETEIDDAIRSARARIEETSRMLAVQGIEAQAFVRAGVPSVEIAKTADEEDVSVIWMSSHGKGWFSELLVGSTAYSVAMNAKRPVIILRGQEKTGAKPQFSPA